MAGKADNNLFIVGQKVDEVPGLRSVVGALTGRFPTSAPDAAAMDAMDAIVGLVPVVGDVIGIVRTVRWARSDKVPKQVRNELAYISAADMLIGIVPGIGDAIDAAFVSNLYAYYRARGITQAKEMVEKAKVKAVGA